MFREDSFVGTKLSVSGFVPYTRTVVRDDYRV